ncbi:MAG: phage terminase small subunit, partial [Duganella sp.]
AADAAADTGSMAGASIYELMLVKLHADRRRLKDILSVERKIDVKRELLAEYDAYVDGALVGGRGAQDEVLTNIMVWRIDVGDFAGAMRIGAYALQHGLTMPDQYERTLATVLAEEVAEAALHALKVDPNANVETHQLLEVATLTDQHDMPDQVRAKLHKAMGYSLLAKDPTASLRYLERALELFDRVGVKQDIARLQKQLGVGSPPATNP